MSKYKNEHSPISISWMRVWTALIFYLMGSLLLRRYWPALLIRTGLGDIPSDLSSLLRMCARLLLVLGIMVAAGQTYIFRRKGTGFLKGLVPGGYILFFAAGSILYNLYAIGGPQLEDLPGMRLILYYLIYFLFVGVTEELLYRGIAADMVLRLILRHGKNAGSVVCAVLLSGALFSLMHSVNLLHADSIGVLIQMLGAFFMGMLLTAVYYRTSSIYVVIFLHVINDIAGGLPLILDQNAGGISGVISGYGLQDILLLLPYIAALLIVLRRRKLADILEQW